MNIDRSGIQKQDAENPSKFLQLRPFTPKTKLKIGENHVNILDGHYGYLTAEPVFLNYFNSLPSIIILNGIDHEGLLEFLEHDWADRITIRHQRQLYKLRMKRLMVDEAMYVLDDRLLLEIDDDGYVKVLHRTEDLAFAMESVNILKQFARPKKAESKIHLIMSTNDGLQTTGLKVPKPRLTLATHYNDDLLPIHERLLQSLRGKQNSGLFLMHGVPGSGKSTYIRYLIHKIRKRVIFLSPNLCSNLDAPAFTRFLIDHQDSVFIVEDAEEMLLSRETGRNSGISMLLNLTDGLLGESLGIQIIATFNTDLQRIDKALLRKGRLTGMYEFKHLTAAKTKELLLKQGHDVPEDIVPMTLADIYNYTAPDHSVDTNRRRIGFSAMSA